MGLIPIPPRSSPPCGLQASTTSSKPVAGYAERFRAEPRIEGPHQHPTEADELTRTSTWSFLPPAALTSRRRLRRAGRHPHPRPLRRLVAEGRHPQEHRRLLRHPDRGHGRDRRAARGAGRGDRACRRAQVADAEGRHGYLRGLCEAVRRPHLARWGSTDADRRAVRSPGWRCAPASATATRPTSVRSASPVPTAWGPTSECSQLT